MVHVKNLFPSGIKLSAKPKINLSTFRLIFGYMKPDKNVRTQDFRVCYSKLRRKQQLICLPKELNLCENNLDKI